ncbi:MAG: serine hydrolase domain-containing protein [Pseudomonadota bacterium]
MTRRTLLASGLAAPALAGAAPDPLDGLLGGDGDPDYALPAWAGVGRGPRGRRMLARAEGLADVAARRPMTTDSPARIASVSKLAATLGFMTLVEAGRVSLDDDVSDILGWTLRHPRFPNERITPRRLLSHTSGLRDGSGYPVAFGFRLSDALTPTGPFWKDDGFGPDSEPPGHWFAYCNTGFAVIGQLVERIAGEAFGPFMTATVFRPLGLDCGYNWSGVSEAARGRAAVLYRKAASDEGPYDPAGPWIAQLDGALPARIAAEAVSRPWLQNRLIDDYAPGTNGFVFSPQGGLRASVRDLDRLARLIAGGGAPLLKPETLRLMIEPAWRLDARRPNGDAYGGAIRAYGLGCQTLTGVAGDDLFDGCEGWIGHAGDAYGLTSGLWVEPGTGRSMTYVLTGEARSLKANRGRSNFTRQEEAIAGALSRV